MPVFRRNDAGSLRAHARRPLVVSNARPPSGGASPVSNPEGERMNTSEFAKALAARTDMTVTQATDVTKHFLDLVKEGVNKGERIAFLGFGTFSTARRPARTGVNPQNPGQKVKIPARTVVKFTPGASLKEAAKGGKFKPLAAAKKVEKKAVATAKKATPRKRK